MERLRRKQNAIYMNGTDLAEEIYKNYDINYAIEQLEQAIEGIGRMYSYRELSEFTALYFYGTSFSAMKEKMNPFVSSYLLCPMKTLCIMLNLFISVRLFIPTWPPYITGVNSIFVHGGPCYSEIPYERKYQENLEKNFTIVHYD